MTNKPLILLVDDIPENIQVLGSILKSQGYSFALTTNGKETYELLSNRTPDIILLDIMLPDEDGFSICEKIKSNAQTAHIPVIFLSAKAELTDKTKGFKLGAADYITKPFEDIEVIARVKNHLQAKLDRDKIDRYNKELEEMVEQRTKELIRKERESILAQFMQGIIHNVRGPIASISSGLELMETINNAEDICSNEEAKNEIWEINTLNKEKAMALMSDLDSMLRKSRDDHSEETEIIDLNELISQELNFLNVDLEFKNRVNKQISLIEEPLNIKVVPAEISQIIQNLIKNAMDAMYQQNDKAIFISTNKKAGKAIFTITDNGPGIAKENVERIFDPFFTTKPKASEGENGFPTGTGIGLRFCRNTAKSYNGNIIINPEIKKGASFVLELPLV
ncbi:MAG: hypothetical protein B7C24_06635 [Bacteroidetes bacterium 4572_77]|nr:MAG: hypothetical protein B7C24_06635 [Bacteroidetes bacterium 4572_77]